MFFARSPWADLFSASHPVSRAVHLVAFDTCPIYLLLLFFTVWVRNFAFVIWCSSLFEILLGKKILRVFRKHLFWKVSILWAFVNFQHSAPYSKTLRTLLLKILSLALFPTCFDFQMFFSMAKDWLVLVILEMTSLSESPSVANLLPRYVNLFMSSMSLLFIVTGSFGL